jgi:uncharacterized protein YjiS (DUF1127 family)
MTRSVSKEFLTPASGVSAPVVESLARLAQAIGRRWLALRVWRDRVATIHQLSRLDERMLKDVGLSRYELGPLDEDWPAPDADVRGWPLHRPD